MIASRIMFTPSSFLHLSMSAHICIALTASNFMSFKNIDHYGNTPIEHSPQDQKRGTWWSWPLNLFGPIHQPKKHLALHCGTLIQELKGMSFASYPVCFHQSVPLQMIIYSLPKDTAMQATRSCSKKSWDQTYRFHSKNS